ncbi:hypothetical protein SD70_12130 [Gordoniibacillus kamchatkensis]|uniref:Flagellar protein FliT n=2 Tax=Gordoniibacillus kamchatkensis TaxID=1590651 RepID=A0ABR5AI70_9BACL|nr:hypothetical protein SD70_12130 [Paenibacillus sp. VKM B-2647]
MLEVTKAIANWLEETSLDEDTAVLESLQSEQAQLRQRIQALAQPAVHAPNILHVIQDCLQLEEQIQTRLQQRKAWLGKQITSIHDGNKIKDAYLVKYTQTEGFFVDRQK